MRLRRFWAFSVEKVQFKPSIFFYTHTIPPRWFLADMVMMWQEKGFPHGSRPHMHVPRYLFSLRAFLHLARRGRRCDAGLGPRAGGFRRRGTRLRAANRAGAIPRPGTGAAGSRRESIRRRCCRPNQRPPRTQELPCPALPTWGPAAASVGKKFPGDGRLLGWMELELQGIASWDWENCNRTDEIGFGKIAVGCRKLHPRNWIGEIDEHPNANQIGLGKLDQRGDRRSSNERCPCPLRTGYWSLGTPTKLELLSDGVSMCVTYDGDRASSARVLTAGEVRVAVTLSRTSASVRHLGLPAIPLCDSSQLR